MTMGNEFYEWWCVLLSCIIVLAAPFAALAVKRHTNETWAACTLLAMLGVAMLLLVTAIVVAIIVAILN